VLAFGLGGEKLEPVVVLRIGLGETENMPNLLKVVHVWIVVCPDEVRIRLVILPSASITNASKGLPPEVLD
jgi:hypothetical protein